MNNVCFLLICLFLPCEDKTRRNQEMRQSCVKTQKAGGWIRGNIECDHTSFLLLLGFDPVIWSSVLSVLRRAQYKKNNRKTIEIPPCFRKANYCFNAHSVHSVGINNFWISSDFTSVNS